MGLIPGYENDIFISYAQADNQPPLKGKQGWVDFFEELLRSQLNERLGEEVTIFRDPQLRRFGEFPEQLLQSLKDSAVLVCVLSPRYLKSDWCMWELQQFCENGGKGRIIKVVKTALDDHEQPPQIKDVLDNRFYRVDARSRQSTHLTPVVNPDHLPEFFEKVEVIAQHIVELLKKLRQSQRQTTTSAQTTETPKIEAPAEKKQAAAPKQRPRPVQPAQESKPLFRLPFKSAIKVKPAWLALSGAALLVAWLGVLGYRAWNINQSAAPNEPLKPSPTGVPKVARQDVADVTAQSSPKPSPTSLPKVTPSLPTFEFETAIVDSKGAIIKRQKKQARYFKDVINNVSLEMVELPGGTFMMGTAESEKAEIIKEYSRFGSFGSDARKWVGWQQPQHEVTLKPFSMGKYEVTQAQWRAVAKLPKVGSEELKTDPATFKGDNLPVETVSWYEAQEFCRRLSRATGREYRLPSEAEWEYAARAGTTTAFAFGPTITSAIVNYDGNYPYGSAPKGRYRDKTVPVGSLGFANALGLFDMHGNVWEWCEDVWHDGYGGAPTDGSVWSDSGDQSRRVLRGGSWYGNSWVCRSAYRYDNGPGIPYTYSGFRVVVSARTP